MFKLFLVFTFLAIQTESANILFYFTGGTYSHDIAVWPWVIRLAERNHSVTFFSTHPKKPWKDPRIKVIAPPQLQEINSRHLSDTLQYRLEGREKAFWKTLLPWSYAGCKFVVENPEKPETREIFFKEKYDIVILDSVLCDCGHILAYYHKAKVILSISTSILPWHHDTYGFPSEFNWLPASTTFFQYPMHWLDMIENYFETSYWTFLRRTSLYPNLDTLVQNLFAGEEHIPSFAEIERRTDLIFVNTHPAVDMPRSLPPNIIEVGGMQLYGQKNASISERVEAFIGKAEDGVILIALGSSLDFSSLPKSTTLAFFRAFKQFPKIHFIGKAIGEKPAECPDNLLLDEWIPQKEIFAHSKTIAGITHGGLNGILEATWYGVPLITIPIFAEQDHQSYKLQAKGVGVRLEIRDVTEDILISAIFNITANPSYRENMKMMQAAFQDRPLSPLDNAVYWTEYLLRHSNVSFLSPITYQPWRVSTFDFIFENFHSITMTIFAVLSAACTMCLIKLYRYLLN